MAKDTRPCVWCGGAQKQSTMILCDRCNRCYYRDCAAESGGSMVHDGPWFCATCKGELVLHGFPDVTQDWALIDYLWVGSLPEDIEEVERLTGLAEHYRAKGTEL